jgi:hypothetical protein
MKFKHTAILLVAALFAVVGLIVYSMSQGEEEVASGEALFPGLAGLKAADIDTVELARTQPKDERLTFTRVGADKAWKVTAPVTANVEPRDVDALVESVLRLKPIEYADLKNDAKVHGLDTPTVKLTLRQGSGKTATLHVGLTTIGGTKAVTFVATSAVPDRPLAVRKSDLAALWKDAAAGDGEAWTNAKSLTDFRQKRLLGTTMREPLTDATAIRVKAGGKELSLKSTGPEGWRFAVPDSYGDADPGGDTELNRAAFTGVRPLLNFLTTVQWQAPADVIESPSSEDLAKYGLNPDDATVTRIELTGKAGTEVLYVGKAVEGDAKPAPRYARLDGDSCVVKVPFDRFDALLRTVADPSDMRNRDVIPGAAMSRVDALDLTAGGFTVKLRKFGKDDAAKWYLVNGTAEPREANFFVVDQLLQAITRPRLATGFPAKPDPANFAPAEIKAVVSLWTDALATAPLPEAGKSMPEPPLKGQPTVVTFGKKETDAVVIKREGKGVVSEFLVPDSLLPLATKGRLDFLAAGVPAIPTNKVTKATLGRPGGPVEVVRATQADPQDPNGKWTFAKPADRKDKIADPVNTDALLGVIATMRAAKVVSETPAPAELTAYGLAPAPRLKVSLELSDEPGKVRSYEFGSATSDGGFVYARHSGSTLVYTVPKVVVDRLLSDDLRDAIPYRIDRAKLNGVALRGWSGVIPVPPTHEYVRKGNEWSATSPPGAVADGAKMAAFLQHVEQPRALRFLGPIKPEHKLDVANGAVEVTLKQDGLPPVVLTLGAETDNGLNFISSVSTWPGEAFVIPAASIRVFAGSPGGLLVAKPVAPAQVPPPSPDRK